MEKKVGKIDISALSISELVDYEKAVKSVVLQYENNIKMYDGSIRTEGDDFNKYNTLNKLYLKILSEMEKRLLKLL